MISNEPRTGRQGSPACQLGTVIGIWNKAPDWFEGDWPREPMALIKWPGHKKLTFEPLASLIQVQL